MNKNVRELLGFAVVAPASLDNQDTSIRRTGPQLGAGEVINKPGKQSAGKTNCRGAI